MLCCVALMCLRSVFFGFVFFVKKTTAYEMRISDWSSDVCSSDLRARFGQRARQGGSGGSGIVLWSGSAAGGCDPPRPWRGGQCDRAGQRGRAYPLEDRKSVV